MHAEQIAEHGGRTGIRDAVLLSSALARPQNQAAYGESSVFDLAAGYAFGIIEAVTGYGTLEKPKVSPFFIGFDNVFMFTREIIIIYCIKNLFGGCQSLVCIFSPVKLMGISTGDAVWVS